jgi:hypothetical protein
MLPRTKSQESCRQRNVKFKRTKAVKLAAMRGSTMKTQFEKLLWLAFAF